MFETMGNMLFSALLQVAQRHLASGHPCLEALRAATQGNSRQATLAVQEALADLDPATANLLMAEAHKILRESPAHILGAWNAGHAKH